MYQLRQDEIGKHWEVIRLAIEASHPSSRKIEPAYMERIQEDIMAGEMEVWGGNNAEGKPSMIAVLKEAFEIGTREPTMTFFALYSLEPPSTECWWEWFGRLKQRCMSKGIRRVTAYTQHENMRTLAQRLGADVTYALLEWRF